MPEHGTACGKSAAFGRANLRISQPSAIAPNM